MHRAGRAIGAVLVCLLPVPVLAQGLIVPGEAYSAAVTKLLDEAIAEHTLFLTCAATERQNYQMLLDGWNEAVIATGVKLAMIGFDVVYINDFANRASVGNMLDFDRPFSDVVAYCNGDTDWLEQTYTVKYILLPNAIDSVPLSGIDPATPDDAPEILGPGKLENAS
jgi:hypothetical protein